MAERGDLSGIIRKGFYGNPEEIQEAEAALASLLSDLDQLESACLRFQAKYGEAVADPLTELRLRLQRGE